MITIEVIKEKHKIAEYGQYWKELFDSDAYEMSTSFVWTRALLATALLKDDGFRLMVFK
jgi:hypothetical protein